MMFAVSTKKAIQPVAQEQPSSLSSPSLGGLDFKKKGLSGGALHFWEGYLMKRVIVIAYALSLLAEIPLLVLLWSYNGDSFVGIFNHWAKLLSLVTITNLLTTLAFHRFCDGFDKGIGNKLVRAP